MCPVEFDLKFLNVWRDLEPQTHPDDPTVTQNKLVRFLNTQVFLCLWNLLYSKNITVWSAKNKLKQMQNEIWTH